MIERLKMVNWKSHANTEMTFSPGTNLLIGTMGAGKTSCLDSICFAFFGTFPSLKSRQVNLADLLMSRPEKKNSGVVEVTFTTTGKRYTVVRTVSPKGTEAFLRCEGALLEGPQPVRTTEAIERVLKIDYDTFARIIYGEQNKLDYFLTLAKGARKSQLDDVIGISMFENVRTNCNALISKLKTEKNSLDAFLSGVDMPNVESELNALKKALQVSIERKTSLESTAHAVFTELEVTKKNLESLIELKKINEELSMQLVKTQTEADSLYSSAVSVMPSSFSSLTREQCTSLLEECSRAIQEQSDLERQVSELTSSLQRLEGEALVVRQIIEANPVESLKMEIKDLSQAEKQLELSSREFLEITKRETTLSSNISTFQTELQQVSAKSATLASKVSLLTSLERQFSSIQALEEQKKQRQVELMKIEKNKATKLEVISSLEKSLELLQKENAVCPTCDQPIVLDAIQNIAQQKSKQLEMEKTELAKINTLASTFSLELSSLESSLSTWVELLPLSVTLEDLKQRETMLSQALASLREELAAVSVMSSASREKVDALKRETTRLNSLREKLIQAEKSSEKLEQINREMRLLKDAIAKKNVALSTFDEKKNLELKLSDARAALKAFELFEKTEALKIKACEVRERLSHLSFDENSLHALREKYSSFSSNFQSTKVSLDYVTGEIKERSELISKLETQFSRLSNVKKQSGDLERAIHWLTVFQNSVVETQGELRTELVTAVNEAMHEVWKNVYPYRDYSSCRVVPTEDDYSLEVLSTDGWKPVEQCSGGEKTCVALSLRVSLAMVLVPNLSWLVLDEPTHNLDSQAVSLLARALYDSLPSIVRQTFVVTHDEDLKEGASGSIHVFQRDKDNGGATIVETLS